MYDDQERERYAYSQVLDEPELEQWFPGKNVELSLCDRCYTHFVGGLPEPTPAEAASRGRPTFTIRNLQSSIATSLATALFEEFGYEVRHSGYEHQMPEWRSSLKAGDPNPAAARIRARPDLTVFDQELNTVYEVEIKSTSQLPRRWRYRKDQLDTVSYHHPEAVLMVYGMSAGKFFVRYLRDIDWDSLPIHITWRQPCYEIDLGSIFVSPIELFTKIERRAYQRFLEDAGGILRRFATEE